MLIETYIALAMLCVLLPVALAMQANRAYQRTRYQQRLSDRRISQQVEQLYPRQHVCLQGGSVCGQPDCTVCGSPAKAKAAGLVWYSSSPW